MYSLHFTKDPFSTSGMIKVTVADPLDSVEALRASARRGFSR